MAEDLYHILYLSSARRQFEPQELVGLLAAARRNNERDKITGLLLYLDGNFIQHIEGEQDAVEACFRRIESNPLHKVVTVLSRGPLKNRQFQNWSMGFRQASHFEPADQTLFHLTQKTLTERVGKCRSELLRVFMTRFFDCNAGIFAPA